VSIYWKKERRIFLSDKPINNASRSFCVNIINILLISILLFFVPIFRVTNQPPFICSSHVYGIFIIIITNISLTDHFSAFLPREIVHMKIYTIEEEEEVKEKEYKPR